MSDPCQRAKEHYERLAYCGVGSWTPTAFLQCKIEEMRYNAAMDQCVKESLTTKNIVAALTSIKKSLD